MGTEQSDLNPEDDLFESPFAFEELYDEDEEESPKPEVGLAAHERATRHKILMNKLIQKQTHLRKKNKGQPVLFRNKHYREIYRRYQWAVN
jgi:hypothetical protein